MLDTPTLVLGIGAQKAGTTWLHDYFGSHPNFLASPIKETNFFTSHLRNSEYSHIREGFLKRYNSHIRNQPANPSPGYWAKLRNLSERVIMDYYPQNYINFFTNRLNGEKCFGEISPSYADLEEEEFKFIHTFYPNIKLIFIMRCPLERLLSHIKFDKKLNPEIKVEKIKEKALSVDSRHLRRSQYEKTIVAIEKVFGTSEINYMFYESMFNTDAIISLCRFLSIDYHKANFLEFSNKNEVVTDDFFSLAEKTHYLSLLYPTYEFCIEKFGEHIPETWLSQLKRFGLHQP